MKQRATMIVGFLALAGLLFFIIHVPEPGATDEKAQQLSDHFNGSQFFNPDVTPDSQPLPGQEARRGSSRWIWRWIFGNDWLDWPVAKDAGSGPPPLSRAPEGVLRITPIGHATFLIQMDGINLLTDPIWSERCSPVSWIGPKRHRTPGIRFGDLPAIDVVLVSHNHYDHLDLPTIERLVEKGTPRAVVTVGNVDLLKGAGMPKVHELDWWQSIPLSKSVKVTLVPAQHFSSRTLWDRNKTLWGGFVISGPSGKVFFSGDTGYGPHFLEIARRFSPIKVAILPISPFRTQPPEQQSRERFPSVHMRPSEAVQTHVDLGAEVSIAAHYQVFQLGPDGFDDAVNELTLTLNKRSMKQGVFVTPVLGQAIPFLRSIPGT